MVRVVFGVLSVSSSMCHLLSFCASNQVTPAEYSDWEEQQELRYEHTDGEIHAWRYA